MYVYSEDALRTMKSIVEQFDETCKQAGKPEDQFWLVVDVKTEELVYKCETCYEIIEFADSKQFADMKETGRYMFHKGALEFSRSDAGFWRIRPTNEFFSDYKDYSYDSCFSLLTSVCCDMYLDNDHRLSLIQQDMCRLYHPVVD